MQRHDYWQMKQFVPWWLRVLVFGLAGLAYMYFA